MCPKFPWYGDWGGETPSSRASIAGGEGATDVDEESTFGVEGHEVAGVVG